MSEIREMFSKKLGFGCMRLPVLEGDNTKIDDETFIKMIDSYLEQGFTYFDTAYPYHGGKSEEAIKRCLVERYPREKFYLADKMPVWEVKEAADIEKIFQTQLKRCGVDYFDFYLLHAMNHDRIKEIEELGGIAYLLKMKEEGHIKHLGFSFHDTAEALEDILKNHPELEFVQLQLNYYDWESENVQSRKCYETAVKYGKPVIVMEPVKGGMLANMIGEPERILKELDEKASIASFAIRYVASLENVFMVLSGMSNVEQLQDNTSYMKEFQPLSEKEHKAIEKVVEELQKVPTIACTKCRYCVEGCPMKIQIPNVFWAKNFANRFGVNEQTRKGYQDAIRDHGKASDCIKCGKCEGQCPQHLEIRKLLEEVVETFEK